MGQSSGWLMSRNSMTPSRAFLVISELVRMRHPFITGMAQAATGCGAKRGLFVYFSLWVTTYALGRNE